MKAVFSTERLRNWAPGGVLFVLALALFSINNGFKLGLHTDELLKVKAVGQGQYQYYHPLLMLEVTKFATWLLGVTEPQAIVDVGRQLSGLIGAAGVAAMFLLLRRRMGELTAVALCLAAVMTPLLAVHAHYLKEDIWLFAFCVLTVLAYRRLREVPELPNVLLLGLALGLAVASKAVGLFLVPVLLVGAWLQPGPDRARMLKSIALGALVAVPVIVLCNLRMLFNIEQAWAGLSFEFHHGATGNWDGVVSPPAFHLTHSIWPGLGSALLFLAVVGLVLTLVQWRRAGPVDRLMVIYAVTYYGLIEASPLKTGADMVRYAVPLVLPAAYLGGIAVEAIATWIAQRVIAWPVERTSAAIRAVIVLALIPTAIAGARLVMEMKRDTRLVANALLAGKEAHVVTEGYGTSFGSRIDSVARVVGRTLNPNVRYLVASSFTYDRFAEGASGSMGVRDDRARRIWSYYEELFRLPFCEIRPRFMSYAFSNPTIRIIDLQAAGLLAPASTSSDAPLGPDCVKQLEGGN